MSGNVWTELITVGTVMRPIVSDMSVVGLGRAQTNRLLRTVCNGEWNLDLGASGRVG
jgi:hypothetical protein